MNIKEAAEQAVKLGLGMRRRNDEWPPGLIVFPTDTVDCCVLELETEGKKSRRRGWEPYADDLIAEDWELVTDEEKRLKGLLNSNFDEKDLTVSIHYAPDRTETQSRKQEEQKHGTGKGNQVWVPLRR